MAQRWLLRTHDSEASGSMWLVSDDD